MNFWDPAWPVCDRADSRCSQLALALNDNDSSSGPTGKRPVLPRSLSSRLDTGLDLSDTLGRSPLVDSPTSISRVTSSADPNHPDRDTAADEEKVRAIIQEFGDIAGLMRPREGPQPEPERMLAEATGSLFKYVLGVVPADDRGVMLIVRGRPAMHY